ncbi:MAG: DUF6465 family protein [Lachnospiraceae bacterium]|nr:DUF6465 family protein [Lachnospiraceae bacterium]
MKETFVLQFGGKETTREALKNTAKDIFTAAGNQASDMKKLELYVQPENGKVYYVINDDFKGDFDL